MLVFSSKRNVLTIHDCPKGDYHNANGDIWVSYTALYDDDGITKVLFYSLPTRLCLLDTAESTFVGVSQYFAD